MLQKLLQMFREGAGEAEIEESQAENEIKTKLVDIVKWHCAACRHEYFYKALKCPLCSAKIEELHHRVKINAEMDAAPSPHPLLGEEDGT